MVDAKIHMSVWPFLNRYKIFASDHYILLMKTYELNSWEILKQIFLWSIQSQCLSITRQPNKQLSINNSVAVSLTRQPNKKSASNWAFSTWVPTRTHVRAFGWKIDRVFVLIWCLRNCGQRLSNVLVTSIMWYSKTQCRAGGTLSKNVRHFFLLITNPWLLEKADTENDLVNRKELWAP